MIEITITYNGKKYDDIGDALNDAAIDKVREHILKKLKPFAARLKEEGAKPEIVFKGDIEDGGKLVIKNISDELSADIKAAMGE